jgi:hypothetical protein
VTERYLKTLEFAEGPVLPGLILEVDEIERAAQFLVWHGLVV